MSLDLFPRKMLLHLNFPNIKLKRFLLAPTNVHERVDKGPPRVVCRHTLSRMKHKAVNYPGLTIGAISGALEEATMSRKTLKPSKKRRDVNETGDNTSIDRCIHTNVFEMSKENMKVDFSKVLFIDKSRATLALSDCRRKCWVVNRRDLHQRLRPDNKEEVLRFGLVFSEVS